MQFNFLIPALAALIPLVVGFIWYNPKVLGTAWMQASGMTEEKAKKSNMIIVFGLTYVFSFFVAVFLMTATIHQFGLSGLAGGDIASLPEGDFKTHLTALIELSKDQFRGFKHGALHGGLCAFMFVLPVLGINAMFEGRGFKYIAINVGYWFISLMLMGGVVCAYA